MSKRILTEEMITAVVAEYDGTTETINRLVAKFQCARHNITNAARLGGYVSERTRVTWTPEMEQWFKDNYGRLPVDEIMTHLGCSYAAILNKKKRLGFSTRDFDDFSIHDLEDLTKIDHRLWHRFIEAGWLTAWHQHTKTGVSATRITVNNLKKFLTEHPEVWEYQAADTYTAGVLELHDMPAPPKFKRITCQSNSWQDGQRLNPVGPKIHHGESQLALSAHTYSMQSCFDAGGTDIWVPLYEKHSNCPRCGCLMSRFSDKAIYTDEDPGELDVLNHIAGKLGLQMVDGKFVNADGLVLSDEQLLRYIFSTKRNAGDAFNAFHKLLNAGLKIAEPNPVSPLRLLPNILGYELRAKQLLAFDSFMNTGNVGIYWPPGTGKMYFLGMVYTRLPGNHILFVNTDTIREQWIVFFQKWAPDLVIKAHWKPRRHLLIINDPDGKQRCTITVYTYMTSHDFTREKYVVSGFDEAHFLPGNNAHRLSMIDSEFRVGLTATPFREDGRSNLIQIMTGLNLGEDWDEFREDGSLQDVPVRVLVVEDLEHKYQALRKYLGNRRTIIFSDSVDCGHRIAKENEIPFIYSATKDRLAVLSKHKTVCMSRVGDCGIDITDLEEVIEFNFHKGSRNQELQRYGRLLHSRNAVQHTIMMTRRELSLYSKRLNGLELRGFKLDIEIFTDPKEPIALPPPVNKWLQILGQPSA